jgi:hypothetical protein
MLNVLDISVVGVLEPKFYTLPLKPINCWYYYGVYPYIDILLPDHG